MSTKPDLRIIRGGRDTGIQIGAVRVTPASPAHPPFAVSVRVRAEDTWRILSAGNYLKDDSEHPIKISTNLINDKPVMPGEILIRNKRWLAIVFDLDQHPICREEWVTQALARLLRMAGERGLQTLGLPLLGSEHDGLPWQQSLALTIQALRTTNKGPEKIWLMVNRLQIDECWKQLQHASTQTDNT